MRFANLDGRAVIVVGDRALDVEASSGGRFAADPQALFDDWPAFTEWAATLASTVDATAGTLFDPERLGAPVPRPRQVFAIGINYAEHAAEAGYPPESLPVTFTKFSTCIVGPDHVVELPAGNVDWEVELVAVIGRPAHRVDRDSAWEYVAGLTIGQDLSERIIQLEGKSPQFSMGKSFPGFGPTGPWLVTVDDLANRDDLALSTTLSGQRVQDSRTSHLIYDVAELIARLSAICRLLPGDLVFTGTPAGVGNRMNPQRFIGPDDVLVSAIEGIGTLTTRFAASP